ncbi:DUF397 domain-containing protein [Actinomadura sp. WMMB 499]|uniref:DUF397 domain-containing protein n=1 Tax=Actinomadura sp. WMMB 499 TaxID=1219491 RepID=UPI001247ED22|nr:DUF397 domain-containing protein [Actinomadura sp. WMMB 499]QFG24283.1 DUF397 domain-containing protein [Actinomadura sp. WMMB 499]
MELIKWRKARRSGSQGDACVEVAALPGGVGVRDSKDPGGGRLTLTPAAFRRLVEQWK